MLRYAFCQVIWVLFQPIFPVDLMEFNPPASLVIGRLVEEERILKAEASLNFSVGTLIIRLKSYLFQQTLEELHPLQSPNLPHLRH